MTHSFPTRRASDLVRSGRGMDCRDKPGNDGIEWIVTRGLVPRVHGSTAQAIPEIDPAWVVALDHVDLPRARPVLHRLLALDCRFDPVIALVVDETLHAMRIREAIGQALTMLVRSEEHTSELQSLMRNSYAVFCLK